MLTEPAWPYTQRTGGNFADFLEPKEMIFSVKAPYVGAHTQQQFTNSNLYCD